MDGRLTLPALALVASACGGRPTGEVHQEPAAAQHALYALAPADTRTVLAVSRASDLVERMRSLDAALAAGASLKPIGLQARQLLRAALGFDPLEGGALSAHGIDASGPLAIFARAEDALSVAVMVRDVPAFEQTFAAAPRAGGPASCSRRGALLLCSRPAAVPAADDRMWHELDALAPVDLRNVDVSLYSKSEAPLWVGARLSESAIQVHARLGTLDTPLHELRVTRTQKSATDLVLLPDAAAEVRLRLRPEILWNRLLEQRPAARRQIEGAIALATGMDPAKDIVPLLTGRLVFGSTESGGTGVIFETEDRAKTERLVASLQDLIEGALRGLRRASQSVSLSSQREVIAGSRALRVDVRPRPGAPFAIYLGAVRRGIAVTSDAATIAAAMAAQPTPIAAAKQFATILNSDAPIVLWSLVDDPLYRSTTRPMAEKALHQLPQKGRITEQSMRDAVSFLRSAREVGLVVDATDAGLSGELVIDLGRPGGAERAGRAVLGPVTLAVLGAPYLARLIAALERGADLEQAATQVLSGRDAPAPKPVHKKKKR